MCRISEGIYNYVREKRTRQVDEKFVFQSFFNPILRWPHLEATVAIIQEWKN